MNCNTFKKYIKEYINDELFLEVKDAMDDHLSTCKKCKDCYEEEVEIDKLFSNYLEIRQVSFQSSRAEIIGSINKNRYSKNPISKLKYKIIKNKLRITATALAACFAFMVFKSGLLPQFNNINTGVASLDLAVEKSNIAPESIKEQESSANNISDNSNSSSKRIQYGGFVDALRARSQKIASSYDEGVEFQVSARSNDEKYNYPSSWKISPSKRYAALIDGKGEMLSKEDIVDGAREEGDATIVIRDTTLNQYRSINVYPKENQMAPLYIDWVDDNNLLVVVGFSQGTVVRGGDLYLLNIDYGNDVLIYPRDKENNEQVAVVEKKADKLLLSNVLYKDNNYQEPYIKEESILFDEVTMEDMSSGSKAESIGIVGVISAINELNYTKAKSLFLEDYDIYYNQRLGNLEEIIGANINKLVKVENYFEDELLSKYDLEKAVTYFAEVDYRVTENYKGPLNNGIAFQSVVLVKAKGSENWKVADIFTVPDY